jgi:hypothetical protein
VADRDVGAEGAGDGGDRDGEVDAMSFVMKATTSTTTTTPPPPRLRARTMSGGGGAYAEDPLLLSYNINGRLLDFPPAAGHKLREAASGSKALYPTLSLFSQDTRAWCRFCEADIVYKSRSAIGAPPGKRVYCLDGSLMLADTD